MLHVGLSQASPATIRRAHSVHPIAALQTECSLWSREPEVELLPSCASRHRLRALLPLGHGLLTGHIRSVEEFADDDWRKTNPRLTDGNFERNLAMVDEVRSIGAEFGPTPAQTALAWILAKSNDIVPIPGTRRVGGSRRTLLPTRSCSTRPARPSRQPHPDRRRAP